MKKELSSRHSLEHLLLTHPTQETLQQPNNDTNTWAGPQKRFEFSLSRFVVAMIYTTFFPLIFPVIIWVHGKVGLYNIVMVTGVRNVVVHSLLVCLLLAYDVLGAVQVGGSEYARELFTSIIMINLMFVVYVVVLVLRFSFVDNKKVFASANANTFPTISMCARPDHALILAEISQAERRLDINAHDKQLRLTQAGHDFAMEWCFSDGAADTNNKTEISVHQAVYSILNHAAAKTKLNRRVTALGAAAISALLVSASLLVYYLTYRDGFRIAKTFGVVSLVTGYFCLFFPIQSLLVYNLLMSYNLFVMRSQTFASCRAVLGLDSGELVLDRENYVVFVWIMKMLRRIGSTANAQMDVLLTLYFFLWVGGFGFVIALVVHGDGKELFASVVVLGGQTFAVTFLLFRIIVAGAKANDQHLTMRQQLLELKFEFSRDKALGVLIAVLDHVDELDGLKVLGLRCSKLLVKSMSVLLVTVCGAFVRFVPSPNG